MSDGYDQAYEDRLFGRIGWPDAGYRLFEIGHFVGGRDWLDGVWESNCMFVPRAQLEQVGGFDENFSMPGGGFANLDLYERLGSSPDVTVVSIIGEGSFHQLHGGVSTNQAEADERHSTDPRLPRALRRSSGPALPRARQADPLRRPHQVSGGSTHTSAPPDRGHLRRRRRRRPSRTACRRHRSPFPRTCVRASSKRCGAASHGSDTTWLGRHIESAPTDLIAYQQAIASVRPDWIVETGTGDGARDAVPRVDLRPARSRPGRLDRRGPVRGPAASPAYHLSRGRRRRRSDAGTRVAASSGRPRRPSSSSAVVCPRKRRAGSSRRTRRW